MLVVVEDKCKNRNTSQKNKKNKKFNKNLTKTTK